MYILYEALKIKYFLYIFALFQIIFKIILNYIHYIQNLYFEKLYSKLYSKNEKKIILFYFFYFILNKIHFDEIKKIKKKLM